MNHNEYLKIQKENPGLPDFAIMDKCFNISSISEDESLLRGVAKKMKETVDEWISEIESWINPESADFGSLHESEYFGENQKQAVVFLYKKLWFYKRYYHTIDIDYKSEKAMEFILKLFADWQMISAKLLELMSQAMEFWRREQLAAAREEYFG